MNTPLRFLFFCIVFLLVYTAGALAQTGTIRGFVYDKDGGEPIIFTNVYLKGTPYGASTDVNGHYAISKVPEGNYTLMVSYLGFDTLKIPISLTKNQIISKLLHLTKSKVQLQMVEISAEAQARKTEIQTSVIKITPKQMKQIPTIGGEPDLAQYLQVLPGVVFTGDQGGQLFIRGGSPIQNKVLLDGMVIYNPFHSIGLFSVFDADLIRSADVYTGGFNAEYGGRISSVMDITTRDGNRKHLAGKTSVNPFAAKLMVEGPLKKYKEGSNSSSSYVFSAKHSYLKQSSKLLYADLMNNITSGWIDNTAGGNFSEGLPYTFTDLYGKVSFNGNRGSKFNIFGFSFDDQVNYQQVSDLHWNSTGFGSRFLLVPSNTPILVEGNFSFSKYSISLEEENANIGKRESSIGGFNVGLDFTYFLGKDELKYGLEVLGFNTDFSFVNQINRVIEQQDFTTEIASYVKYKKIFDKLIIEPSFRLHFYASLSTISPEPRLGLKYNATDKLRIKFAGGLYSQNLISAVSDRDVVNLFYGFLSGPENLQKEFDGKPVNHALQKATHAILGFEYDVSRHMSINIEGYYKFFNQLTNINRNKLFDDTPDFADRPDHLKKDFIVERGSAYGADFLLKYDRKRWYLWVVYTLGFVTRFDDILTDENGVKINYNPHFDRRHNANIVSSYTFGKDLNWEVDLRWNLGTGFPFTQTQGIFEKYLFEGGINTDYTEQNGEVGYVFAPLNQGRLPIYHRMDFTIKRKFEISDNSTLEAVISVTNIYNRQNIFFFDRTTYQRVDQLPLLPTAGVSLTF
ncbi:MAG: TonB-dependent receptor [Flavobacteriales bacterium]|nr:TonB-dependent receptor [Flavobacteriales bacterium]